MMRIPLFLLLLSCSLHGKAQALLVLPGTGPSNELQFNPLFIQRNNIASITGQRMVKRDGEPMREQKERYLYRFNPSGLPVYANHSYGKPGTGTDTASTTFTYDTAGRVRRRREDKSGKACSEKSKRFHLCSRLPIPPGWQWPWKACCASARTCEWIQAQPSSFPSGRRRTEG